MFWGIKKHTHKIDNLAVGHENEGSPETSSSSSGVKKRSELGPRTSQSLRIPRETRKSQRRKHKSFTGKLPTTTTRPQLPNLQIPANRTIANGLKLAQTQAIAVAGFDPIAASNAQQQCESCFSHRASYHGRGDHNSRKLKKKKTNGFTHTVIPSWLLLIVVHFQDIHSPHFLSLYS